MIQPFLMGKSTHQASPYVTIIPSRSQELSLGLRLHPRLRGRLCGLGTGDGQQTSAGVEDDALGMTMGWWFCCGMITWNLSFQLLMFFE